MSQYIARIDGVLPTIGMGPTLYKLDSTGRLRTWAMELNAPLGRYRTLSGLADGKQAESGWTDVVPKSKETAFEQARFEVLAQYDHQLNREYHLTADTVSQPKMIEPMLAKTYDKFPGPGTFDPKFDGIRCIADINGLWTRQGQPIIAVPHIHAALAPLFAIEPDAVIDGELYNHDLREDFGAISSIVRKKNPTAEQLELAEKVMQYHAYDLVTGSGNRSARKLQLAVLLDEANIPEDWIRVVLGTRIETEVELRQKYGEAIGDGYEGGIFAPDGYEYEIGRRSKGLLKMKDFITEEFRVMSIEAGTGNWAGAAKRMSLINNEGFPQDVFGAGIRGSYAKNKALLADWQAHPEWWPTATATVRFFMRSPDGVPRFPVVVDFQPEGRKD
jgi:DNA ligase-1